MLLTGHRSVSDTEQLLSKGPSKEGRGEEGGGALGLKPGEEWKGVSGFQWEFSHTQFLRGTCVRVFQQNRTNSMWVYREINFKEQARVVMGAGKAETCRAGRQTETLGGVDVAARVQRLWEADLPLPQGRPSSFSSALDWVRFSVVMEYTLLYSESNDLNGNTI